MNAIKTKITCLLSLLNLNNPLYIQTPSSSTTDWYAQIPEQCLIVCIIFNQVLITNKIVSRLTRLFNVMWIMNISEVGKLNM